MFLSTLTGLRAAPVRLRRAATSRRITAAAVVEGLESRTLLSALAVVSLNPTPNAIAVPAGADISVTFDQPVNGATVTDATFVVHGSQSGTVFVPPSAFTVTGSTVTLNPTDDFHPGETVSVTLTTGLKNPANEALAQSYFYQFQVDTTGGSGVFVDSNRNTGVDSIAAVATGDLDGDGDLDIFALEYDNSRFGFPGSATNIWLNNGTGSFVDTGRTLAGVDDGRDVCLGDIDGDGDLDAFIGRFGNHDQVWRNDGAGNFSLRQQFSVGYSSADAEFVDLDGDGDLDINLGEIVWFNDGNGLFTGSGQVLVSGEDEGLYLSLSVGDVDGDGDADFLKCHLGSPDEIWINNGEGFFTDSGQRLSNPNGTIDSALGDLDGDGDLDAVVKAGDAVIAWLNDGQGVFTLGERLDDFGDFGGPGSLSLGDLDGDRDLDIFGGKQPPRVWLNDSNAHFTEAETLPLPYQLNTRGGAMGDFDGDGDLDVFLSQVNGPIRVLLNQNAFTPIALPAGGGSYELLLDGTDLVLREEGGAELFRDDFARVRGLQIEGSSGNDELIVDVSSGIPIPALGVAFDGAGDINGDSLRLLGTAANIEYTLDNATDGQVVIDGKALTFTGVESSRDTILAAARTFTYSAAADALTLSDEGLAANDISQLLAPGTAPPIVFRNPTASLVLSTRAGNDTITLDAPDSLFAAALTANGGNGDDQLAGGNRAERLAGGAGHDLLNGRGGNDTLDGEDGIDTLLGGAGFDSLKGGTGNDRLSGQGGEDTLTGQAGDDRLTGGTSADLLLEIASSVSLTLTDTQLTGLGTDILEELELVRLEGGAGATNERFIASGCTLPVTLIGNDGSDTLYGGSRNDSLDGGAGNDSLRGSGGRDLILGGLGNDSVQGNGNHDTLGGGGGNDTIEGAGGDDSLLGGDGDDTMRGSEGNDILEGDGGNDTLNGGAGNDTLNGGEGHDGLAGLLGDDALNGANGADTLVGGGGNDTLFGGAELDILLGGDDDDQLRGQGDLPDTLAGGAGNDRGVDFDMALLGNDPSEIDESFVFTADWIDAA